jgi:hypothetical protein
MVMESDIVTRYVGKPYRSLEKMRRHLPERIEATSPG